MEIKDVFIMVPNTEETEPGESSAVPTSVTTEPTTVPSSSEGTSDSGSESGTSAAGEGTSGTQEPAETGENVA